MLNINHRAMGLRCQSELSENLEISYLCLNDITSLLHREDFQAITDNSEFFWIAFCSVFKDARKNEKNFEVYAHNFEAKLVISGFKPYIQKLKTDVELIRQTLFSHPNDEFFVLSYGVNAFIQPVSHSSKLDITQDQSELIKLETFTKYLELLPKLSDLLGRLFVESSKVVQLKTSVRSCNEFVKTIKLALINEYFPPYAIEPVPTPFRASADQVMFSLFKQQKFCDLILVTKQGSIRVPSIMIYAYGGPFFEKLLDSGMKETIEKKITLDTFSYETVSFFIEYIFLGDEAFNRNARNLDAYELLRFAHSYQIQSLIDSCTNLLTRLCSPSDIETIKILSDKYQNEHLKKLYLHFYSILNPNQNIVKV